MSVSWAVRLPSTTQAVADVHQALAPWAAAQTYSNYREGAVAPERLWDAPTLQRLHSVTAAYDPANVIQAAHPLV
jgi:hypothetical protein